MYEKYSEALNKNKNSLKFGVYTDKSYDRLDWHLCSNSPVDDMGSALVQNERYKSCCSLLVRGLKPI